MTGLEPFVDPLAGGLIGVLVDTAKKIGGSFAQSLGDRAKASTALKRYADKYVTRYGTLKLLGMQKSVSLEIIYTKVKFLDGLSIRQFTSLEALEKSYREGKRRRFQGRDPSKLDAPLVVNETQFLMVLGGPGAGKSTFLRRTGLEALKGERGSFKHNCIPVMLELKRFSSKKFDLTKAIAEELSHFEFPASSDFVINLLEHGKLLILLDGLDEVPKANLNFVVDEIQNFVTRYDKNRYIASCRIAAHRSTWNNFRDIELADFDDNQIRRFIHNWFHSELDRDSQTSEKCWETLNKSKNAAAKELAQTPLLLTFLCMVYDRTQGFPTNRATLYRKALDILLEEWAAEKRIRHETIYEGLNPDLEKVLLAEIGYTGFASDQLFFTQQELVNQIKSFLADTVDKPKLLDGAAILNAIAVQQGILVERAEDVFSFSHLTLQEHLTAQYLSQDMDLIKEIVWKHLIDQRWREVFLLVSGSLQNSDKLLEVMTVELNSYLKYQKIKEIFNWISQSTSKSKCEFKPLVKRILVLAVCLFFAGFKSRKFAKVINASIFAAKLAISLDTQSSSICNLIVRPAGSLFSFRDLIRDLEISYRRYRESYSETRRDCGNHDNNVFDEENLYYDEDSSTSLSDFEGFIGINIVVHPNRGFSLDTGDIVHYSTLVSKYSTDLTQKIQELNLFNTDKRQKISEIRIYKIGDFLTYKNTNNEVDTIAILTRARLFLEHGSRVWWQTLNIPEEWSNFIEEEVEAISNYLYVTELIVRCKESAVRVSDKVWTGIQDQIITASVD